MWTGNQLVITYDEDLDTDSNPPTSSFAVRVDGTPVGVTRVGISGMTVSLTLASATYEGQTVTVSYTSSENVGDNRIRDLDGSLADDLTDLAVDNRSGPRPPPPEDPVDPPPVVDNTPPVRGATFLMNLELTIRYNEELDPNSNPATDAFTVTVDGVKRTIADAYVSGAQVYLILATPGYQGQTVTVSYEEPSTKPIQDTSGNKAPEFANVGVQNQSGPRPTDRTPPERVGTPTVDEATTGESVVTIEYNEELEPGSPPPTAFTVSIAGDSAPIDRVEVGETIVSVYLAVNAYQGQTVTVSYVHSVVKADPRPGLQQRPCIFRRRGGEQTRTLGRWTRRRWGWWWTARRL